MEGRGEEKGKGKITESNEEIKCCFGDDEIQ